MGTTQQPNEAQNPPGSSGMHVLSALSRVVGAAMLLSTQLAHSFLGVEPNTELLGIGFALLSGKDGIEFIKLVFGRS